MEQNRMYDYVGWVPCLNGELVFELVECGLNAKNDSVEVIHYDNDSCGNLKEYILLNSTVDWKDFDDKEMEVIGLWSVFVLSIRPLESKRHEGSIFFMPNTVESKGERNEIVEIVRDINYQLNTNKEINVPDQFLSLEKRMTETCLGISGCYRAEFILEQDGIVWIDPSPLDEEDRKIIARQAYYYIKYSWHKHQHHDHRAETLTTIHKVHCTDGSDIAERLVGDLKRNLVKFKREIDHTSHRDILKAKGIVTYAKALVEVMRSKRFVGDSFYNREINHLSYFKESLDISSAGIEKDMSLHNQAVNDARAFVLFVFAMITPALIVNNSGIKEAYNFSDIPSYIQWITSLYATSTNFLLILGIVTLFLFSYISINSHYGNFWIFWGGIKKSVAFIVKDRLADSLFSNTNIMCFLLLIMSFLFVIIGVHGLFLTLN